MILTKFDIATRIYHLSLEIKHLVEENNIPKRVVIEDFEDVILGHFQEEHKDEDN